MNNDSRLSDLIKDVVAQNNKILDMNAELLKAFIPLSALVTVECADPIRFDGLKAQGLK